MRCYCCDRNLNNFESTLKSKMSGDYLEMCMTCVREADIDYEGRNDLSPFEVLDEELPIDDYFDLSEYSQDD